MKKLFLSFMMSVGALTIAAAQDPHGVLTFSVPEMVGTGQQIVANVEYIAVDPGTSIEHYQWELRPVTPDGIVGEPVFSQNYDGDPSGEFTFPESVSALLTRETSYQVLLNATDNWGDGVAAGPKGLYYSNYVLTGPQEICCGDKFSVVGSYSGDPVFALGMTHEWTVTECDAAGNPTTSNAYYTSGVVQGYPFGTFTFPSTGYLCDKYYKVQVTFNPSNDPYTSRPVTRSVIVHFTSFMLTANANYCTGQYMYASGRYCQGPGSPVVLNHQWKLYQSNAAGAILSGNIIPLIPLGGAPYGASEVIIGTNNLAPGYYLLQLDFLDGSNTVQGSRTQVISVNPTPQPVITGGTTCASGSFSASPGGAGYIYQWSAFNGNTPFAGVSQNGNSCYVGTGLFNTVKVTVTSPYGCSGHATKSVTTQYVDPGFHVQVIPYGAPYTDYYVALVRNATFPGQSIPSDYFTVEISSPTNIGPFSASCWAATTSWQYPTQIYLNGFNGTSLPVSNCPFNNLGHFLPGYTYLVTHYVTYNGCTTIASHYFNENGCIGCRTSGPEEVAGETTSAFDVYPNPGNGSFTIQLPEAAENAQALLFDMMGKRVDGFTFSGTTYTYTPVQTLASGVYMLNVINNGVRSVQKLIVE